MAPIAGAQYAEARRQRISVCYYAIDSVAQPVGFPGILQGHMEAVVAERLFQVSRMAIAVWDARVDQSSLPANSVSEAVFHAPHFPTSPMDLQDISCQWYNLKQAKVICLV